MDKDRFLEKIRGALAPGQSGSERPEGSNSKSFDMRDARLISNAMETSEKIALFQKRAESSGAKVTVVASTEALKETIRSLVPEKACVAFTVGEKIETDLGRPLASLIPEGCTSMPGREIGKDSLFDIHTAITGVDAAVAETGSIVLYAGESNPRLISLTAEKHIALLTPEQIVPDLLDWTKKTGAINQDTYPQGFTLISGPSKTADIELQLVTGVHGPAELTLIVINQN